MATEVRWTPRALADLDAICKHIAKDSPSAAEEFAERVFGSVERLAELPLSGRVVPEKRRKRLREIIVQS